MSDTPFREVLRELPDELTKEISFSMVEGNELRMVVRKERFADMVAHLHAQGGRLISLHATDERSVIGAFKLHALLDMSEQGIITVACPIEPDDPRFTSLVPKINAANWYEREIQDMFGLVSVGHPDPRPLILYDDWPQGVYPLRKDFNPAIPVPRIPQEYRYRMVEGEGVFEIPVGPVHAGVIEPGHFRFSVAGEPFLRLEIRLGYTHRGVEKLSEAIPYEKGVFLAERISGDTSVAHSTAYCQTLERLSGTEVPERAEYLRTIFLEMERLYNHVGDIAGIALDTAFSVPAAQGYILKERMLELNERLTGSRLLRSVNILGGVSLDITSDDIVMLLSAMVRLKLEFEDLCRRMLSSNSMLDRVETTGMLTKEVAEGLGCVGPAARASGIGRDVRKDHPYAAYKNLSFLVPRQTRGDVKARMMVRMDEVRESFSIIEQALDGMPGGPSAVEMKEVPPNLSGFSLVEAPRGETMHWILAGDGKPFRHKIRDPSFCNWLAMEFAVLGDIVPDFPLINKSFSLSYAGNDL